MFAGYWRAGLQEAECLGRHGVSSRNGTPATTDSAACRMLKKVKSLSAALEKQEAALEEAETLLMKKQTAIVAIEKNTEEAKLEADEYKVKLGVAQVRAPLDKS